MMRKNEIKVGTIAPPHPVYGMCERVKKWLFGSMGVIAMYFVRFIVYVVCVYLVVIVYVYIVYGYWLIVW